MKRSWIVALLPPLVIGVLVALLLPEDSMTSGVAVGLVIAALMYIAVAVAPYLGLMTASDEVGGETHRLVLAVAFVATLGVAIAAMVSESVTWRWVVALDVVIVAVALASTVILSSTQDRDAARSRSVRADVADLRRLAAAVEAAGGAEHDPQLARQFRSVAESIRLSPFVGVAQSREIEQRIEAAVAALSAPGTDVVVALDDVARLVAERNNIVKANQAAV